MKKLISALLALALMLALSPPGHADYDPKVDYLSIMLHAAEVGDIEAGRAAAICRNEQIDIELTGETKLDFDELFLLAKIICAEAGSPQLSDDWRMCVGEVVLNRVASPEFPDSIHDVVYEPGQYQEVDTFEFAYVLMPTEECVNAARAAARGRAPDGAVGRISGKLCSGRRGLFRVLRQRAWLYILLLQHASGIILVTKKVPDSASGTFLYQY